MSTTRPRHATERVPDAWNGDSARPRWGWQVSCACGWDGGWWAWEDDAKRAEDEHRHFAATGEEAS